MTEDQERDLFDKILNIQPPKGTFKCPTCLKPFIFESSPVMEPSKGLVGFQISFECEACEIYLELGNETRISSAVTISFGEET